MTPAERSRFARIGGITAHQLNRAHEWTRETARAAGRKGGLASGRRRSRLTDADQVQADQAEPGRGDQADQVTPPEIVWYPCGCGAEHDTPTCPFGADRWG